jgi:hypothetical protein
LLDKWFQLTIISIGDQECPRSTYKRQAHDFISQVIDDLLLMIDFQLRHDTLELSFGRLCPQGRYVFGGCALDCGDVLAGRVGRSLLDGDELGQVLNVLARMNRLMVGSGELQAEDANEVTGLGQLNSLERVLLFGCMQVGAALVQQL